MFNFPSDFHRGPVSRTRFTLRRSQSEMPRDVGLREDPELAVLLDAENPGKHWITPDDGRWLGASTTNRAAWQDDQTLGTIELQADEWNRGQFRREDDRLILTINGKDIYQQTVDTAHDGRWGFFHDPSQFQVKIRNVKLTGAWPLKIPDSLWE